MTDLQRHLRHVFKMQAMPAQFMPTWRGVREYARPLNSGRSVYAREGRFCNRCAAPTFITDSACRGCRGEALHPASEAARVKART